MADDGSVRASESQLQAPVVLNGVIDGGLVLSHRADQSLEALTLSMDGRYLGPLNAQTDPGLKGAGLKSFNQLADPRFTATQPAWMLETPQEGIAFGVGYSEKWNLSDGNAAYIRHDRAEAFGETRLIYTDPVEGERITVSAGAAYEFGVFFGLHRCEARITLAFFDAAGRRLHEASAAPDEAKRGGARLAAYAMARGEAIAPAKARWASLVISKTGQGGLERPDSLLLIARPWFGQAGRRPGDRWRLVELESDAVAGLRRLDRLGAVRSRAWLPAGAADGMQHRIDVLDADGRSVVGAPVSYRLVEPTRGVIEAVKGAAVTGWARSQDDAADRVEVRLMVDGRPVASARADGRNRQAKGHGYRFNLPVDCMDGLAHRLSLVCGRSGQVLDERVDFLAVAQTSFDKLQRLGATPRAWQAPAARQRYEGLQVALRAAAEAHPQDRAAALAGLAQISLAHDVLMTGFEALQPPYAPLAFPVHAQPRVSIVVPAHNKFAVTYHCLAALLFAANRATFEVIVVDDGSTDETREIETVVSGLKVVRHQSAEGFIDACNNGAAQAAGDYIVLLNNDTEPTVGWLDAMLEVFEAFDDVGVVGAKLLYPDGRLQEAGGVVWETGDPWNYGRNGNAADPRFNYVRQVDYLSGACLMVPAPLWTRLGGLSEAYRPAYFEDTDFCFKVQAVGLKVVYTPFAEVYHFEGVSSGVDVTQGMKRFQEINRPRFKERWSELFVGRGAKGVDVDLNKDRGVARRALMLDIQTPRLDNDAGSYAALQEIRLLQSLGFKVSFAPRNAAYMGVHTERLQRMGVEALYAPHVRSIEDLLIRRGGEFDLIYVTRYMVAADLLPLIRRHAPQARLAFCNADLHFLRELREAVLLESGDLMAQAQATRQAEVAVVSQVDVTLSYTAAEHVVLEVESPGARVAQAPWIVEVAPEPPPFEARRNLAFLGGFAHPPNKLAVEFLARDVMPGVRTVLPDVACRIYGSGLSADVAALQTDGVPIEGFAPDLKAVYDTCRIFVAPLLTGAGLKGKVINALAYGTPSVLSPIAAEGAHLRDGVETMIARTPQEWVTAIRMLYEDPDLWLAMSRAAQAHAARFYSFEAGQALMRQALALGGLETTPDRRPLVSRAGALV